MRLLVIIPFVVCLVSADVSKVQDEKTKQQTSSNAISSLSKQEQQDYYQQPVRHYQPIHIHPQAQTQSLGQTGQYVHVVPKPVYYNQQPAMIIIAHPALVPSNLLQNAQAHQLINYFHSHPRAKYQLLYGNYQSNQQQRYIPQQVVASQPNYQIVSPNQYQQSIPYYHQTSAGAQVYHQSQQAQTPQYQQQQIVPTYHQQPQSPAPAVKTPTTESLKYADLLKYSVPSRYYNTQSGTDASDSSKYYNSQISSTSDNYNLKYYNQQTDSSKHTPQSESPKDYSQLTQIAQYAAQQYLKSPSKAAPALITGFENFSPEQQAQIRSQLTAHFGQINDISPGQTATAQTPPKSQYSSRYIEPTFNDFQPSPEIKGVPSAPGLDSKEKYGKN